MIVKIIPALQSFLVACTIKYASESVTLIKNVFGSVKQTKHLSNSMPVRKLAKNCKITVKYSAHCFT